MHVLPKFPYADPTVHFTNSKSLRRNVGGCCASCFISRTLACRRSSCRLAGTVVAIAAVALASTSFAPALSAMRGDNIANLALVLGEQTTRSVQAIDLVVRELQEAVGESNVTQREILKVRLVGRCFVKSCGRRGALISQAEMVGVIDATGGMINTSRVTRGSLGSISRIGTIRDRSQTDEQKIFVSRLCRERGMVSGPFFLRVRAGQHFWAMVPGSASYRLSHHRFSRWARQLIELADRQ